MVCLAVPLLLNAADTNSVTIDLASPADYQVIRIDHTFIPVHLKPGRRFEFLTDVSQARSRADVLAALWIHVNNRDLPN